MLTPNVLFCPNLFPDHCGLSESPAHTPYIRKKNTSTNFIG